MVIDTSALIAILQDEPERRSFNLAIESAETRLLSAASFVESSLVIETRVGADGIRDLDLFVAKADISIEPVDTDQAYVARQAYSQYGKGRHPAGLNYGDCFTYALAKLSGEPLLFKGHDFSKTDLDTVIIPE
jgi:ribonuclease VapC